MANRVLDISICVVLYRSEDETIRFHEEILESLTSFNYFEILYYDNSPTNILQKFLKNPLNGGAVKYFHDERNLGFAYANNSLILSARFNKILLLNSDVYGFSQRTWEIVTAQSLEGNIVFAKLLNRDGTFQDCVGRTASISRALSKRINYGEVSSKMYVEMGIMAFMLCGKDVFARVGLLDCRYSLYAEDMDWCYRASRVGLRHVYEPKIVLTHIGGASAKHRWESGAILRQKYLAEQIFINIHFRGLYWLLMSTLNVVKRCKTVIYP